MAALETLLATAPAWAACVRVNDASIAIEAAVPRAGDIVSRTYHLILTINSPCCVVKEAPDSRLLPTSCPDRHVNADGTFCLGLRAGYLVEDSKSASEWWSKLLVFLNCQETAHESRSWPEYAQLSHGDEAAGIQLDAEDLARELGLQEEYKDVLHGDDNVIATMASHVDLKTMHLRNGRSTCVCGRSDKRGRPLLRRQCWKTDLKCLPIFERRRQEAVKRFWATLIGTPCCGTMDNCPLSKC